MQAEAQRLMWGCCGQSQAPPSQELAVPRISIRNFKKCFLNMDFGRGIGHTFITAYHFQCILIPKLVICSRFYTRIKTEHHIFGI